MIIYNVTLSINPTLEEEVLAWLKDEHIPEVLETGLFIEHHVYKIIENPTDRIHNSYAVQYTLTDWEKFEEYTQNHAARLRAKTMDRFGENVLAFRTFLEKI